MSNEAMAVYCSFVVSNSQKTYLGQRKESASVLSGGWGKPQKPRFEFILDEPH